MSRREPSRDDLMSGARRVLTGVKPSGVPHGVMGQKAIDKLTKKEASHGQR